MLQSLEMRRLLSSSVTNSILTITGTDSANTIGVSISSGKLKVSESGLADKYYTLSSVNKIVADAKGGHDKITVASNVTRNCELKGGSGNDTLRGGGGVDALLGGDGNDNLEGGAKNDYLDGGKGSDTIDYSSRTQSITAETHSYVDWTDVDNAGSGGQSGEKDKYIAIEKLIGGSGKDKLQASSNVAGNFELVGGAGNDSLTADGGNMSNPPAPGGNGITVSLRGGSGNDLLLASGNIDSAMYGDGGDDTLSTDPSIYGESGTTPPLVTDGGSGSDVFKLYPVSDKNGTGTFPIVMGAGLEALKVYTWSSGTSLKITGNDLDNKIDLYSGAKIDLDSRGGADRITIAKSSSFNGSVKSAILRCGSGNDVVYSDSPVTVYGGSGDDEIHGSALADQLLGEAGNDKLFGGSGNDTLNGGSGSDKLFGDSGNDKFYADDSTKDTIDGGSGTDKARRDSIDVLNSIEGSL
jgi:Ca2+-binding RTX toxin-like protein